MRRGQLYYAAFDDVVVAHRFFGLGLETVQRGGEIVAGRRGSLRGGLFMLLNFSGFRLRSGVSGVVLSRVRGGSFQFHR